MISENNSAPVLRRVSNLRIAPTRGEPVVHPVAGPSAGCRRRTGIGLATALRTIARYAARLLVVASMFAAAPAIADCVPVSAWVRPEAPAKPVAVTRVIEDMARKSVVLLGEVHDDPEQHRWQLQTLAALHTLHPDMAIGFEMFPRRAQPALDRWVAGELSESAFLEASDWRNVWHLDPALYLPMFHYARMQRIPMIALDLKRGERAAAAPHPAPPSKDYVDMLRRVYAEHPPSEFDEFVAGQTRHDRVLAQSIARALAKRPQAMVVGIMGRGHVEHGYGVPHQLHDLGVRDVGMLLPWTRDMDCDALAGIADAVFGIAAPPPDARPPRQLLGVTIESAEGGVRILAVSPDSIAQAAGLRAGDRLLEIAGLPARRIADVRAAVERQAPGTWLPLKVSRDDETLDKVAKFPPLAAHAAAVHYDMDVRVDPVAHTIEGRSLISAPASRVGEISLAPQFKIDTREERPDGVAIRWHGKLDQTAFVRGDSGWYPHLPGALASYRLTLDVSGGQIGVVPGTLLEEKRDGDHYHAQFDFPHPGEAIDLMIGPYKIEERMHESANGRQLRLRTYFHPEIAGLAAGYLDSVARYIDRYERWIGDYPFGGFSVVSSPTSTGYGMPSLTYLGVDVLKLPFIRATSLGHEVLHDWWGNGVYPDYEHGNWSEGLTTFMADYAYREDQGEAAARETRLGWLRDISAVPAGQDQPLTAFRSRTHETSQIVGYRKAAMVFFMLRDLVGARKFDAALREFWRAYRFRVAGWSDLRRVFEAVSGRDLGPFFDQWLTRRGAPRVSIAAAHAEQRESGWQARVTLTQNAPAYDLRVPIVIDGKTTRVVDFSGTKADFTIDSKERPQEAALDPDFRVLRRLGPDEAPPVLRAVMVASRPSVAVLTAALKESARALASELFDHTSGDGTPNLVIGSHADIDTWLAREHLSRPAEVAGKGTAQVWTVPRSGAPLAIVSVRDADALAALLRPLPHYGGESYLAFDESKAVARGVWPARPQTVRITP